MAKVVYIFGSSLMHHGIKGQEWGVQNGPPYPLNPIKDYSPEEQKANAKNLIKDYNSIDIRKTRSINYKNNLISENTKDLKILHNNIENKMKNIQKIYDDKKGKIYDNNGNYIIELKPLLKEVSHMQQEYTNTIEKFTNNIVGKFGDVKLKGINDYGKESTLYNEVRLALNRSSSGGYWNGKGKTYEYFNAEQIVNDYYEHSTLQ